MTEIVNIVVTCAKDKRPQIEKECQLRNLPNATLLERLDTWEERTCRFWKNSVRVADLYIGDHWATVRAFRSPHFEIDVWVCSAGYGLIHFDDRVAPYAATFTRNHPDSVCANLQEQERSNASSAWWDAVSSRWRKHLRSHPRTLSELMTTYPKRSMLVVASDNYIKAIESDLRRGIPKLANQDQLSIVCAGVRNLDGLNQNLIPSDARLQELLGGARSSLNTRLASKIIRESPIAPRASTLRVQYEKLLNAQPPLEKWNRKQLTDDEARTFIKEQLDSNPKLQHSPMLRLLRDQNMACEQKRFAKLYREVVDSLCG